MVKAAFFFVPQAPGYEIVQGALTDVPVLTAEERDALIGAAGALTEVLPPEPVEPVISEIASQGRPGGETNCVGMCIDCYGSTAGNSHAVTWLENIGVGRVRPPDGVPPCKTACFT